MYVASFCFQAAQRCIRGVALSKDVIISLDGYHLKGCDGSQLREVKLAENDVFQFSRYRNAMLFCYSSASL